MAITFGFYNSVGGDRKYDSEDFATFFDGLVTDGVLPTTGNAFQVTADDTRVRVGSGRAWFNKTWTYNDDNEYFNLVAASSVNSRIDTLVLEIDKSTAVRQNRITWVSGTPSATPVAPTLIRTAEKNQYPLANVFRPRDSATVSSDQITNRVGTPDCPYAASTLIEVNQRNRAEFKNSFSRGNNLGDTFTLEQRTAISNGSFDGLFLGDYWLFGGVQWRIVDFNYFYMGLVNTGGGNSTVQEHRNYKNNIVIVPDNPHLIVGPTTRFNDIRNNNNCGLFYSQNSRVAAQKIIDAATPLFGSQRFLIPTFANPTAMHPQMFFMYVQSMATAVRSMSEHQVYGSNRVGCRISRPFNDEKQFSYYKLNPDNVGKYSEFWLAENYDYNTFAAKRSWGLDVGPSQQPLQERPYFAVTGE